MPTTHEATATWQGDLQTGKGTVSLKSGALRQAATSWKERTEGTGTEGATSPEELLAAAHASCFSMALSARVVTFGPLPGGGNGVSSSALSVRASAPGLTAEKLRELAEDAAKNCPLSKALEGNVAISVQSALV